MLEENACDFMDLGQAVYDLSAIFGWDTYSAVDPKTNVRRLNEEGEIAVRDGLRKLIGFAMRLKLPVSRKVLERHLAWPDSSPQTEAEFERIVYYFKDEIGAKKCLFLPSHVEEYYEWGEIVSDTVLGAFPQASEEIRTAGTCLATGMHTACVFHAMRAAEIGLKSLAAALTITTKSGKPLEQAEWRELLDGLSTAIHAIENLTEYDADQRRRLTFLQRGMCTI